jgi:hypothetical protein
VDPTAAPSPPDESLVEINSSTFASASPYWRHRTFLGLTGIAIAQWMMLADAALMLLIYFSTGGRTRSNEELLRLNSNMNYFAFSTLWFSAIYLLAAPEDKNHELDQALALARKLIIYVGGALVVLTFYPALMFTTVPGIWFWLNRSLPVLNLAALVALFFYLWKLAGSANDSYLRRHLPSALVVLIFNIGFAQAVQYKLLRADDLRIILNILAAAYFLHVILRVRKLFAAALPDAAVVHRDETTADQSAIR